VSDIRVDGDRALAKLHATLDDREPIAPAEDTVLVREKGKWRFVNSSNPGCKLGSGSSTPVTVLPTTVTTAVARGTASAVPQQFMRVGYIPPGFVSSRSGFSTGGQDYSSQETTYVEVVTSTQFVVRQEKGQQLREPIPLPSAARTQICSSSTPVPSVCRSPTPASGTPIALSGYSAYQYDNVLSLNFTRDDVTVTISSSALALDEMLRIAESMYWP
jgi:hypothetical protein